MREGSDTVDEVDPAPGDTSFTALTYLEPGELRGLGPHDVVDYTDLVAAAVLHAVNAVEILGDLDPAAMDPASLTAWAEGTERVRRMADSAVVAVAEHLDRDNPFRREGFFTATSWMRHRLQLSGPEAHRRRQSARLHRGLGSWAEAEKVGGVGVAQTRLMARVAANPRIDPDVLRRDQHALLEDAKSLPYDDFEQRVRTWHALADPAGDRADARRQRAERNVRLRPRPAGGWTLSGSLDELSGSEFNEILAHFAEAEWETDWTEARSRLGEKATTADLGRTDAQRHADALLHMARAAAGSGSRAAQPTVNIMIDEHSFHAALSGDVVEPRNYRTTVCRTQSGRRLSRDDAVNAALVGHFRRLVVDAAGVTVDLSRRSRFFRGAGRDAVMLPATRCVWLGCDRPVGWCDADHSLAWTAHGATVPRNGAPLCRGHNLLKEQGFQVRRDEHGKWHFTTPDGTPMLDCG